MALAPTRIALKLALSHVDRGVDVSCKLVGAQHPSETPGRVVLRMLAYCVFYQEGLELGPGLSDGETPDLWVREPGGRPTVWIGCGRPRTEQLTRAVLRHPGLIAHQLLDDPRQAEATRGELEGFRRPEAITLWLLEHDFVAALAAGDVTRLDWAVTIVGDHVYVDARGGAHASPLTRVAI